jgi:hypothetical protein
MSRGSDESSAAPRLIMHLLIKPRPSGVLLNCNFKMVCERPPRSLRSRLPLTRGRLNILPLCEGEGRRKAAGGRSHTTSNRR